MDKAFTENTEADFLDEEKKKDARIKDVRGNIQEQKKLIYITYLMREVLGRFQFCITSTRYVHSSILKTAEKRQAIMLEKET